MFGQSLNTKTMEKSHKSKTLFDFLNDLTMAKTPWSDHSEADKKKFQVWMINRYLSMNTDMLEIVASVQCYTDVLSPESYYNFYLDFLPKKKVYMNYIGSKSDSDSKRTSLKKFLIEATSYSPNELDMILNHPDLIRDFLKNHGYDDEKIKKEFGL